MTQRQTTNYQTFVVGFLLPMKNFFFSSCAFCGSGGASTARMATLRGSVYIFLSRSLTSTHFSRALAPSRLRRQRRGFMSVYFKILTWFLEKVQQVSSRFSKHLQNSENISSRSRSVLFPVSERSLKPTDWVFTISLRLEASQTLDSLPR